MILDQVKAAGRRIMAPLRRSVASQRLIKRLKRARIAILMYHGVTNEPLPTSHWCQLDSTTFEKHVDLLALSGYRVLSLKEVIDRIDRKQSLPDYTVCLTFDDGLRNVRTTAYPILESRGLPATVFLITDLVGTDQPSWPDQLYHNFMTTSQPALTFEGRVYPLGDLAQRGRMHRGIANRLKTVSNVERLSRVDELKAQLGGHTVPPESPLATMNWDEVVTLKSCGLFDFGSHTATHPILSRCTLAEQEGELRRSRDALRERLGDASLLAYPNGCRADFVRQTCRLARELEYRAAVTTMAGLHRIHSDRFTMRRVHVGADTTLAKFERNLLIG